MIQELLITFAWIALGIFYCNGLEWVVHKHVLHRFGRKKKSFWRFHMDHHRLSKKNDFIDPEYIYFSYNEKEFLGIILLAVVHLPTIWISPAFFLTTLLGGIGYLIIHQRSHKNTNWAKNYVPWHWDHHMGPRRAVEANWCVTFPLFDIIMGTRVKYLGTKEYYLDIARRSSRRIKEIKK